MSTGRVRDADVACGKVRAMEHRPQSGSQRAWQSVRITRIGCASVTGSAGRSSSHLSCGPIGQRTCSYWRRRNSWSGANAPRAPRVRSDVEKMMIDRWSKAPETRPYDHAVFLAKRRGQDQLQFARPLLARAQRLAELGRFDEALVDFDKAVELAPDDWQVQLVRATFLADRGDWEASANAFRPLLAQTDGDGWWLEGRRVEEEIVAREPLLDRLQAGAPERGHLVALARVAPDPGAALGGGLHGVYVRRPVLVPFLSRGDAVPPAGRSGGVRPQCAGDGATDRRTTGCESFQVGPSLFRAHAACRRRSCSARRAGAGANRSVRILSRATPESTWLWRTITPASTRRRCTGSDNLWKSLRGGRSTCLPGQCWPCASGSWGTKPMRNDGWPGQPGGSIMPTVPPVAASPLDRTAWTTISGCVAHLLYQEAQRLIGP